VVIAIIAILAALLLPALATAKERGQRMMCLSNLKQWGAASLMYVEDHNQAFPDTKIPDGTQGAPPGYFEDNPSWTDVAEFYDQNPPRGLGAWFNAVPSYVSEKPLYYYRAIANGNTGIDRFNNSKTIFKCPTAIIDPLINPNIRIAFQYGMNSQGLDESAATVLKSSMIANASRFVLYSEGRTLIAETPFYGAPAKEEDICKPQVYTTAFSSRHGAGGCITFGDGHASWFAYDYVCLNTPAKAADPGRPDICWSADGHTVP
jgi:type II secretory pathway pseudopilin PulG